MLDAALVALSHIFTPHSLLFLMIGVGLGFITGLLPGFGGTAGTALLLPFLFGMDPYSGIAMLVGLQAVNTVGDTFPSVLVGIPGSAGSQATIIDGYAMAKKGEAARALGASYSASMLGGLVGAVALLGAVAAALSILHVFGSPELFMLTLIGLATVAVVSRGDPLLGIAAAAMGVMIGLVGAAPAAPDYRFTFDSLYLSDGIQTVLVALGIFAIPEILALLTGRNAISNATELKGSVWDGFWETMRHKWLVVRTALIGVGFGIIPGVGGSIIDWIAYAHARGTAKDKSQFGKGDVRGVIGTESATNAKEGGVLIPTIILGIPGNASTAVLLGGLIMLGLSPGPDMLNKNLDMTLTVIWSLVLAHVIATAIAFMLSKQIAKITLVPSKVLAPFLLVLILSAAYQTSYSVGDYLVLLGIGVLGFLMKLAGWPRAPFIIGYVLAAGLERYLHLSISLYGSAWLVRPSVIIFGVILFLILFGGPLVRAVTDRRKSDVDVQELT